MTKRRHRSTKAELESIDPEQVRKLAALHATEDEIAAFFGVHKNTIRRHFKDAIRRGREEAKIELRRLQWQKARSGNVTMLIWLGKQYLGQTDREDITTGGQVLKLVFKPVERKKSNAGSD